MHLTIKLIQNIPNQSSIFKFFSWFFSLRYSILQIRNICFQRESSHFVIIEKLLCFIKNNYVLVNVWNYPQFLQVCTFIYRGNCSRSITVQSGRSWIDKSYIINNNYIIFNNNYINSIK